MEGQTTCKSKKRLKYKNSENVPQLEVSEAILVNCNLVNNIRTRLLYEKRGQVQSLYHLNQLCHQP